jgi:hypothetical protein
MASVVVSISSQRVVVIRRLCGRVVLAVGIDIVLATDERELHGNGFEPLAAATNSAGEYELTTRRPSRAELPSADLPF